MQATMAISRAITTGIVNIMRIIEAIIVFAARERRV